ncbi:MAG: DUF3422 domain-containing protein [Pseudomonadota bacterium]
MLKGLTDHPQRYALTNELHARPFQPLRAPGRVLYIAFKLSDDPAARDPEAIRAHLLAFIDRHGAPHPAPDADHYLHDFGGFRLKWERHTEFISYSLYDEGAAEGLFVNGLSQQLPTDWLERAPGAVIAAAKIEVLATTSMEEAGQIIEGRLSRAFNPESLVVARVLDGQSHALADFRIDGEGFSRFAMVVQNDAGARRIGRLVQRLLEIETYRTIAMLALPVAREANATLNRIEREMTRLADLVAADESGEQEGTILTELTALSAELEALAATTAFRFGAAEAYEALVNQRIRSISEERYIGRQLFAEFMTRRFEPAMRTCSAAERRLGGLALRASRIAELVRTRVDVAVESQNQKLLASMDRRAALQLRLQKTVEGLSVVAISYYAVSLGSYVIAPIAEWVDVSKELLTALIALPVMGLVYWLVSRVRRRLGGV